MKKNASVLVVMCCALLSLFVACDDDSESNMPVLLTEMKYDWDGGYDYNKLEYNSKNQLIKITNTYSDADGIHTIYIEDKYDDNGKLTEEIYTDEENKKQKNVFTRDGNIIRYDVFELLEDGTWESSEFGSITTLNDAGKVIESKFFILINDELQIMDSTVYSWSNGNMVEARSYQNRSLWNKAAIVHKRLNPFARKRMSCLKSGSAELTGTTVLNYDDKKNPISNLGIDYYYSGINKNNVISQVYTVENGGAGYDEQITYLYNDKGYPISGTILSESNGEETITLIYNTDE